ncbi:MAG: hypothetical protein R3D26_25170, partial [Cyanobacteriota/Melainabacteria group bacterium]
RVVNRPVEALHFVIMFYMFGLKPLGYHVFNMVMEIISGVLLFFCLSRFTNRREIAFLATALFVLYPSHNITHYWVVSSSVTLSLVLYLGSLFLNILAVTRKQTILHVVSAFLFCVSNFNYEVFMPLAAINVLVVFYLSWQERVGAGIKVALRPTIVVSFLHGLAIALLFFYLKVLMPMLGEAWMHHVSLDPALILETIARGVDLNSPATAFAYFSGQASTKLNSGLGPWDWGFLSGQALVVIGAYLALVRTNSNKSQYSQGTASLFMVVTGCLCVVLSYLIFGLNREYMPVFTTIINRVNTGASIGLAMIICGVASFLVEIAVSRPLIRRTVESSVVVATVALTLFFTVTNWALSMPFVISWQLQSQIMKAVKANVDLFKDADSILLSNSPRYSGEAPVFDGVWDFEQMIRLALGRQDVHGGVVCDRLHLSKVDIKDLSLGGFLCATHHYEKLYVIISPQCKIVRVRTPHQFIELVEKKVWILKEIEILPDQWRSSSLKARMPLPKNRTET